MTRVDHILVSTPDLLSARRRWEDAGLPSIVGGRHPGGTNNALVRGHHNAYIELITAAGDPTGETAIHVRANRGVVGWALGVGDLEAVMAALRDGGRHLGLVTQGSRQTPEGEVLRWQSCGLAPNLLHPYVPFLIHWQTQMPPGPPNGPVLVGLTIECPEPARLSSLLEVCGLQRMPVSEAAVFTHSDGDVTVSVHLGNAGICVAELELAGEPEGSAELDGLVIHKRAPRNRTTSDP